MEKGSCREENKCKEMAQKINKINSAFLVICLVLLTGFFGCVKTNSNKNAIVDDILDIKSFKKLLRTKTNVLVLFTSNIKESSLELKVFREAANAIRGIGTFCLIDCSQPAERKKLCKKLKVNPDPYIIKHYKDGDFNKDYTRQLTVSSMINFMRDPTGDIPWEEDPNSVDVLHFSDYTSFTKHLRKDFRPMLVMFYVPWCGFCKRLKPEYEKAASTLKQKGSKAIIAAMDVERTENALARRVYNITGFPTIIYFENGEAKHHYDGENNKDAMVAFMLDPNAAPVVKPKEAEWSTDPYSEIVHLTTQGFEPAINDEKSVLIMFYAPWCGHCKRMKPEYEKAAVQMKERKIPGILAALDATKETAIAERFKVKGYPTLKFFTNGVFKFDVNVREADKILEFMRDPKEPPPPPPPEKQWEEEDTDVVFLDDSNFNTTLKRKKSAIVMFYAPWCGHCKSTKPEFNDAAKALKDDTRVLFAAVDCTKHTQLCAAYEVRGYPTIKYFSYLNKIQIAYDGGRRSKDFIEYITTPPMTTGKDEL